MNSENAHPTSGTPHLSAAEAAGIRPRWGWVMVYAIVVLLLGVYTALHPIGVSLVTMSLLGIVFGAFGISAIIAGVTTFHGQTRWLEVILGALAIAAGVSTFLNPMAAAVTLLIVLGAWLLASGVFEIIYAFRSSADRGWRIFMGAIDTFLGIYLLTRPTEVTLQVAITLIAISIAVSLLFRSAFLFSWAFALRRLSKGK